MGNRQGTGRRATSWRKADEREREARAGTAEWQSACCGRAQTSLAFNPHGHPDKMRLYCPHCKRSAVHYRIDSDLWKGWVKTTKEHPR